MTYINKETGEKYYGGSITRCHDGVLFSGLPTEEKLAEWGFEEYVPPTPTEADIIRKRMASIERELRSMDYLTSKELDGEDMTKYNEQYVGGYKQHRRELRAEYNVLEEQLKELS